MIALLCALGLAQQAPAADVRADQIPIEGPTAAYPERSTPPGVVPSEWIDLAEPEAHDLGGGRTAWLVHIPGVRKVEFELRVRRGTIELDQWPTELAQGVGALADLATTSHDAKALDVARDMNDMELFSWIGRHQGGVSVSIPREDMATGFAFAGELLRQPTYPKKEVAQYLRDRRRYFTIDGPSSLTRVASAALQYGWLPADHPYGARPDLGAMNKLSTAELTARQAAWRASGPVTALVTGDVTWEEVEPLLRQALDGIGSDGDWAADLEIAPPSATRVIAVDMPGQEQVALRLRLAAPTLSDPDRVAFDATNWAFGGHFLSRLNGNLREEKGFTYGSGSRYSPDQTSGTVTVQVDVKAVNTAAAITEIDKELARLIEGGITADELDMAREATVAEWNGTRETASTAERFYAQVLEVRGTVADVRARGAALEALTPEATAAVAKKWLEGTPRLWVIVGDRAAIEAQLTELGLSPEWHTPSEAILGAL